MKRIVWLCLMYCLFPAVAVAASLKGSPESIARQHRIAKDENLSVIKNDRQLAAMKRAGYLVPLPQNQDVRIDPRLAEKWRWCRPWTRTFLLRVGREFRVKFGTPLQINSAVRTVEYQKQLRKGNSNATDPENCLHCYGATIDIARMYQKNGRRIFYSTQEQDYIRRRLLQLEKKGLVEATEEKNQAVFHVMVSKTYVKKKGRT